ncbi:hypothetical protein ACHAWF_002898 [Thalassiosira exigua]
MMEVFDCYFDFELAWWNTAIAHPEECLPKTMEYWEANFEGDEKQTRLQQIQQGLKMGRDEVIKITKRYLMKPPILLLVLANRKRGPPFLRAVLSVFYEYSHKIPEGTLMINDAGDLWGRHIYDDKADRPDDERIWYDILTRDEEQVEDLIHFWLQFCLNWPILTADLQGLSNAQSRTVPPESQHYSPLAVFAEEYPVLFECLYAVFGCMMSNSRLCEQVHGMMRHGLSAGIGLDQADHHRQFSTNHDYIMREERRTMAIGGEKERGVRKKAPKHLKTKEQMQRLGEQLIIGSQSFAAEINEKLEPDEMPQVKETQAKGRRCGDIDNLRKEVEYEDDKASRFTRTPISIENVMEIATNTKPTNDACFTFDGTLILWREALEDMIKLSFWKEMSKTGSYKETWRLARRSMIFMNDFSVKAWRGRVARYSPRKPGWWGYPPPPREKRKPLKFVCWRDELGSHVYNRATVFNWGETGRDLYSQGSIFATINNKSRAEEFISEYLAMAKKAAKTIYSYIKAGDKGGFKDKSVKKEDILFLFIRYVDGAVKEDEIESAGEAVVKSCLAVDKHYKCSLLHEQTLAEEDEDGVVDTSESDNEVEESEAVD